MLEYSKLTTDDDKTQYLNNASKELKESLAAHKSLDSLKSREQYYEFISALYKASCVLNDGKHTFVGLLNQLKWTAMTLFHHYCLNQTSIVHDSNSKQHIDIAMKILELPSYIETGMFSYGTTTSFIYSPEPVRAVSVEPGMF